ncbi:MAG: DUF6356 family protein [Chakrabartia sp.]
MIRKLFLEHPAEVEEGYFQHMGSPPALDLR